MNEYKSPFVNALAEKWVTWRPMLKGSINNMEDRMGRMLINSALETFNILDRMPELLKTLDDNPDKRALIEGEIKALAAAIDEEPPPVEIIAELIPGMEAKTEVVTVIEPITETEEPPPLVEPVKTEYVPWIEPETDGTTTIEFKPLPELEPIPDTEEPKPEFRFTAPEEPEPIPEPKIEEIASEEAEETFEVPELVEPPKPVKPRKKRREKKAT